MKQILHNNTNSTSNSFMKIDIITKVVIERFPSRNEIISLLDAFLKDNKYQKDYELDNKDNIMTIIFKQYEAAVEFCKYINIEKINNKLYAKLKVYTILDEAKSNKTPANNKTKNKTKIHLGNSFMDNSSNIKNSCHLHKSGSCPLMERKRIYIVKNTYRSVLASTPFAEKCERIREEMHLNKSKWLQGKNFNSFIGKASMGNMGYVNNYVSNDSSISSHAFQSNLRASDKFTWINHKGFFP